MWDQGADMWRHHLNGYDEAIAEKGAAATTLGKAGDSSDTLQELEKRTWSDLPRTMAGRHPPHMCRDEYARLVGWKLRRGKWRPGLQRYAEELSDATVVDASTRAFRLLADASRAVGKVIGPLLELRGCGPATASAVLATMSSQFPFMSDELLMVATGERKYTKRAYLELVELVRAKATELSSGGEEWSPRDIEKACFAYGMGLAPPAPSGKPAASPKSASKPKGAARDARRKRAREDAVSSDEYGATNAADGVDAVDAVDANDAVDAVQGGGAGKSSRRSARLKCARRSA